MRANGSRQSRGPLTWQGVAFRPPVASPPKGPRRSGAARVAAMSTSDSRKRSPLVVQLATEERAKIAAAASASGLSLSGYARETLLGEPTPGTQRAAPLPEIKTLAALLGQLGMIGSNLNQLAKLGNRGQFIPPAELKAALAAVEAAAQRIEAALE
jgi:hypothetical protein